MTSSQLRIATVIGLRNSLGIFLTAVVVIPFVALIHRIFDGTWYVNWRLMLAVSGTVTLVFFVFHFVSQLIEFAGEEHRDRLNEFVFPGAVWLRGICLACAALGVAVMVGTHREGDPVWVSATGFVFVLLGLFTWPSTIEIGESEIRERRLLMTVRCIPFSEVESVVFDPGRGETVVYGKGGTRIVHTAMHLDEERFVERLEQVTGKRVVGVGDF